MIKNKINMQRGLPRLESVDFEEGDSIIIVSPINMEPTNRTLKKTNFFK
jgi:hypothetical protein